MPSAQEKTKPEQPPAKSLRGKKGGTLEILNFAERKKREKKGKQGRSRKEPHGRERMA